MRCRIIREDIEPSGASPREMLHQTVMRKVRENGRMKDTVFWKMGAIIVRPDAYRLVQQGMAIPADEECREAADRTEEQMSAAQHSYEAMQLGITPNDRPAYDMGYLKGYERDTETGEITWIPGEAGGYEEWQALYGDNEEDEDDDD